MTLPIDDTLVPRNGAGFEVVRGIIGHRVVTLADLPSMGSILQPGAAVSVSDDAYNLYVWTGVDWLSAGGAATLQAAYAGGGTNGGQVTLTPTGGPLTLFVADMVHNYTDGLVLATNDVATGPDSFIHSPALTFTGALGDFAGSPFQTRANITLQNRPIGQNQTFQPLLAFDAVYPEYEVANPGFGTFRDILRIHNGSIFGDTTTYLDTVGYGLFLRGTSVDFQTSDATSRLTLAPSTAELKIGNLSRMYFQPAYGQMISADQGSHVQVADDGARLFSATGNAQVEVRAEGFIRTTGDIHSNGDNLWEIGTSDAPYKALHLGLTDNSFQHGITLGEQGGGIWMKLAAGDPGRYTDFYGTYSSFSNPTYRDNVFRLGHNMGSGGGPVIGGRGVIGLEIESIFNGGFIQGELHLTSTAPDGVGTRFLSALTSWEAPDYRTLILMSYRNSPGSAFIFQPQTGSGNTFTIGASITNASSVSTPNALYIDDTQTWISAGNGAGQTKVYLNTGGGFQLIARGLGGTINHQLIRGQAYNDNPASNEVELDGKVMVSTDAGTNFMTLTATATDKVLLAPATFGTLKLGNFSAGADSTLDQLFTPAEVGSVPWGHTFYQADINTVDRFDQISAWGWNVGPGGTKLVAGEAQVGFSIESFFEPTPGTFQTEWHIFTNNDGDTVNRRPLSILTNRVTGATQFYSDADAATLGRTEAPLTGTLSWDNGAGTPRIFMLSGNGLYRVYVDDNQILLKTNGVDTVGSGGSTDWYFATNVSPTGAKNNLVDLGIATSQQWRTGYFGTSLVVGTDTRLVHTATKTLTFDDAAGGAATFRLIGDLVPPSAGVGKIGDSGLEFLAVNANYVAGTLGVVVKTAGVRPAPSSDFRGMLFVTQGGAGVPDVLSVCLKGTDDAYHWVDIKNGDG